MSTEATHAFKRHIYARFKDNTAISDFKEYYPIKGEREK